jgi:Domain of unknown function (DUF3943)
MKTIYLLVFLLWIGALKAQITREDSTSFIIDSTKRQVSIDTPGYYSTHNAYGDLLNDDPTYNRKYKWYIPASRVIAVDLFSWATAKYFFKYDWPASSVSDWKRNFKQGWEWDTDKFGVNFIGHPHSGSYYFNVARSNGYSFWGSLPFAVEGSLIWEYLGENTRPSLNDVINTPLSGMFLGEVFYRISSNILDDRTRGMERVWREILAGIVNPTRALNRLTQGKAFRVLPNEVYQKEPLNVTFFVGVHKVNDKVGKDNLFGTGSSNAIMHLQLDYGDPFETRHRKPFDLFRLRIELGYGADVHVLDNVNGYGILFGKNIKANRLLAGGFQHFDYWRNNIFEIGTFGYGGGLISRIPVKRHSNIYSAIHLGVVPLAGNNTQYGPDSSAVRRYNFGGGLQGKIEETFNLNDWATLGFTGFYYWIHTYNGLPGNSLVGIFKPVATVKLFKNMRIGFEQLIYQNHRFFKEEPSLHLTRTEQKLFLQFYFEDPQRRGKYH